MFYFAVKLGFTNVWNPRLNSVGVDAINVPAHRYTPRTPVSDGVLGLLDLVKTRTF